MPPVPPEPRGARERWQDQPVPIVAERDAHLDHHGYWELHRPGWAIRGCSHALMVGPYGNQHGTFKRCEVCETRWRLRRIEEEFPEEGPPEEDHGDEDYD